METTVTTNDKGGQEKKEKKEKKEKDDKEKKEKKDKRESKDKKKKDKSHKEKKDKIRSASPTTIPVEENNGWKFLQNFRKKIDHPRLQQYNHQQIESDFKKILECDNLERIRVLTDRTFDQIDTRGNGFLDRDEVQEYLASFIDTQILQKPPNLKDLPETLQDFEMSLHRTTQFSSLEDQI